MLLAISSNTTASSMAGTCYLLLPVFSFLSVNVYFAPDSVFYKNMMSVKEYQHCTHFCKTEKFLGAVEAFAVFWILKLDDAEVFLDFW